MFSNATTDSPAPMAALCLSRKAFRQDSNIRIDTGYLDSNLDFGINTPRDQHWLYRRVTHCAPLKTEGYRESVSKLDGGLDIPYMKYFFGGRTGLGNGNLTYEYPILQKSQVYAENFQSAFADYSLSILAVNYYNGSISRDQSHFTPIKALQRPDADLYMIFLSSNAVMFTNETDDPWYSAHDHAGRIYSVFDSEAITDVYFADEPASPLACLIQHQVCDPQSTSNTTCTPLVSALDLREAAAAIWSDEDGLSTFMFSAGAGNLDSTSVSTLIMQSGLDSDSRRSFGEQGPIPNNQWQRDVARWTNISLAYTQQSYLDAASGPSDPQVEQFYTGPLNDDHRRLCRNQMILTTAYTNFSIFGLATVLVVGGLIIFISYALEPIMRWRKRSRHAYATLEWTMNDTLQVQRMAHEELGMGRWMNCDRDVPITEGRDRLAVLDLEDLKHPRLKVAPDTFEDILAGKPERGKGDSVEETTPEKSVQTTESEVAPDARDSEQGLEAASPHGPRESTH
ncbi:Cytochrome p450 protein [Lasiodiplodia theobromae]|nr:Cytochrome p450 protein [Lasiodiplodia theobromae]KAF4545925.1 Cytochrome p450 protein [Lasiodiplodia theobromae]